MQIHSTPPFLAPDRPDAKPARWYAGHAKMLVVACADGRFTDYVEDFVHNTLGVDEFDCLFVPGGPGSMSDAGAQFMRAEQMRREVRFLMDRHDTEEVVLVWHGPAADGPEDAVCGHYRNLCAGKTGIEIADLQQQDATDLVRNFFAERKVGVRCFRAEVDAALSVRFVEMP